MEKNPLDSVVYTYPIQGGSVRLGANDQGELCAFSLCDLSGQELLLQPGPFLLLNNLPVRVTSITDRAIVFCGQDVEGEIAAQEEQFQIVLENKGACARTVRFEAPVLSYACSAQTRIFDPNSGGNLAPRTQSVLAIYPAEASLCALFFTEPEGTGFGFGYLNREQRRMVLENGPMLGCGRMRATFEQLRLDAGDTVSLPPFYLAVGREWDALLAPYARYADTFPVRTDTPDWVHAEPWVFRSLPIHPFGLERWDDLVRAIDEGFQYAEARGASPVFWITTWWKSCERIRGRWYFDHMQGDFTEAPELVERVIKEVHRRGARIVAYANVTALGEYSDLFQAEADEVLVRADHGGFVRNMEYPMFLYCPASQGARALWQRIVAFMIGQLQLDGIFLDQAGGGNKAPYCQHPGHGHTEADSYGQGMLGLLEQIRTQAKALNPEAVIFGELAQDARDHLVDFWLWHWVWSGVVKQSAYSEGASFFKYARPAAILLDQEAGQCPDEAEAVRALSRGVWLNVYDQAGSATHHTACWAYYRRHRVLLQTRPQPLRTDSPDVAALLYGPVDGLALVGFLSPRREPEDVGVWLPPGFGEQMDAVRWRPSGTQDVRLCREDSGKTMMPVSDGGGMLEIRGEV